MTQSGFEAARANMVDGQVRIADVTDPAEKARLEADQDSPIHGVVMPYPPERQGFVSSDVGDVSWNVPTLHLSVATAPAGVPWHAWPVVAAGGMSIGHKGLVQAAKAMAATMYDLYDRPAAREAVQAEFREKTRGFTYEPFIPDGPPPLP